MALVRRHAVAGVAGAGDLWGLIGVAILQVTLLVSQSKPLTQRPAMHATSVLDTPSCLHFWSVHAILQMAGFSPTGTPAHVQQSSKTLQSVAVVHSAVAPDAPALPPVELPALPPVELPAFPPVELPADPPLAVPPVALPPVELPALPPVELPPVALPPLPPAPPLAPFSDSPPHETVTKSAKPMNARERMTRLLSVVGARHLHATHAALL
jgi:hypothetical protein